MRNDSRMQAMWHNVSVRQPIIFDRSSCQAFQSGIFQWIYYRCYILLVSFKYFLGRFALVIHCVYVGAVGEELADHFSRTRVQLKRDQYIN